MSSIKPLNIVFAGTPDFSAAILQNLIDQGHHIAAVYCQPDRRVGRGKKLAFGPVKSLAVEQDIAVEQPTKFDSTKNEQGSTATETLASYHPDLVIVVAYGLLLPEDVLQVAKYGCVNIHASLLPRWRGAAPIQRAIQAGDFETGVTIMQMDKGLDTGNMLLKRSCPIDPSDTGETLHDRLIEIGNQAINEFLQSFSEAKGSSLAPGEVQDDSLANYAHKLSKAEAEIDWSESAATIERKIRAFNSWPVSFTYVGKNRLRVWQAELTDKTDISAKTSQNSNIKAGQVTHTDKQGIEVNCGDQQTIRIKTLQADGSRAMEVAQMLNSRSQWFVDNPILAIDRKPDGKK